MQDTDSKTLPDLEVRGRWGTNGVGSGEFRLVAWGMGGWLGFKYGCISVSSHSQIWFDQGFGWQDLHVTMLLGVDVKSARQCLQISNVFACWRGDLLQKHGLRKTQPIAALLCVYFNCRSIGVCCSRKQHDIGDVPLTPQEFVNDYNFHWIHEWHRF